MLGVLADFEREQIGERTRMALAHKKANGEVYAATRFGFEAIAGRLVEVKRGHRRQHPKCGKRASLAEHVPKPERQGIEGKRGGRWFPSTVRYTDPKAAA